MLTYIQLMLKEIPKDEMTIFQMIEFHTLLQQRSPTLYYFEYFYSLIDPNTYEL